MRAPTKIALFTFAFVTALATVLGAYFLATAIGICGNLTVLNRGGTPYTSYFFVLFSAINVFFLIMLGKSALQLFRFELSGVLLLSLALKLEILYWLIISFSWLLPEPFGMSAAGATGIGNMGISPQLFIGYPLTGLLALWILKKLKVLGVEPTASRDGVPVAHDP